MEEQGISASSAHSAFRSSRRSSGISTPSRSDRRPPSRDMLPQSRAPVDCTATVGRSSMRALRMLGLLVALCPSMGIAQRSAATCEAVGQIRFICGLVSPEDLAIVPGDEWVIASGDREGGRLQLVNYATRPPRPCSRRRHEASGSTRRNIQRVQVRLTRKRATSSGHTVSTSRPETAKSTRSTSSTTVSASRLKCSRWMPGGAGQP